MHPGNWWGSGLFELGGGKIGVVDGRTSRDSEWDMSAVYHEQQLQYEQLTETQKRWLLEPNYNNKRKKSKYVDFGCIVCSHKAVKWSVLEILLAFCVIALPIIIVNTLPSDPQAIAKWPMAPFRVYITQH